MKNIFFYLRCLCRKHQKLIVDRCMRFGCITVENMKCICISLRLKFDLLAGEDNVTNERKSDEKPIYFFRFELQIYVVVSCPFKSLLEKCLIAKIRWSVFHWYKTFLCFNDLCLNFQCTLHVRLQGNYALDK